LEIIAKILSTHYNLARSGILHPDSLLCLGGCGQEKSLQHLFFDCLFLADFGMQNCCG